MNIIFPCAGIGSRFSVIGYTDPKPFIKIKNKCILEYSLSSINIPGKYFIVTAFLENKYLDEANLLYEKYKLDATTINLNRRTSGAPETCLAAEKFINPDEPLMIVNHDHFTPWNSKKFINFVENNNYDGVVTIYDHPEVVIGNPSIYSHIKTDSEGIAVELAEKIAISEHTLNGIFYWKRAGLFFESAKKLIDSPLQTNGEKYVSQTYNFLIKDGYRVTYYKMEKNEYVPIGTPEEVAANIDKL